MVDIECDICQSKNIGICDIDIMSEFPFRYIIEYVVTCNDCGCMIQHYKRFKRRNDKLIYEWSEVIRHEDYYYKRLEIIDKCKIRCNKLIDKL